MRDNDRNQALATALQQIEKSYGKGAVMRLGDGPTVADVGVISTGSLGVDEATSVGGIPRGRVTEIFGPESSGKTTLALSAIASAQHGGGEAAFVDAEHALDPNHAAKIGVDTDRLLVSQPDDGEAALEVAEKLIRSSALDIVVIDSVAALVPKAELEGDMGDAHVGVQARLMSQGLRKLTSAVKESGTAVVFINQLREQIGVMFGSPETTPGGRALKFYSSLRLDIRGKQALKSGGSDKEGAPIVGRTTSVKVVKNKLGPPFRSATFSFYFKTGIDRIGEVLTRAAEQGRIKKSGAWYSLDGENIGHGYHAARDYLANDPELVRSLEAELFGLEVEEVEETED